MDNFFVFVIVPTLSTRAKIKICIESWRDAANMIHPYWGLVCSFNSW
jgi:hypothetical protein